MTDPGSHCHPRHIRQVGYFNITDATTGSVPNNAWSAYWHGDNYIYVADFQRGLDVLRYTGDAPTTAQPAGAPLSPGAVLGAQAGGSNLPNTSAAVRTTPLAPLALVLLGAGVAGEAVRRRRGSLQSPAVRH